MQDKVYGMTRQKQTKKHPDDEEAKYRALFNSIDEGIVISELLYNEAGQPVDLLVLETNASFERLMQAKTSLVGKRALEIFPDAEASWFEAYGQVVETGQSLRSENYLASLDRWFDLYIARLGEAGDHRFVIVFNDISERKRVEEDLRRSEGRLRLIIENARGYAIFTTDADGIVTSWNPGAAEIFGWSETEILGQNAEVLFTPEDRAAGEHRKELEAAREKGIALDIRWHLRKDGSRVFINGIVHSWNDGKLNGFFKIGRDVTEQRQAEQDLRENQEQLQRLNESLEQKVREKTAEVTQLASDAINATQRERERISRVLHDDLQQRIFALQMQLASLSAGLSGENASARKEASGIKKELADIIKITRDLSIDLSPPILPEEGLARAVEWLVSHMQEQYGLPIELQASEPFVIANENLHALVFNCIRELLFNVVKHAEATRARVALAWSNHDLRVEVSDDGKGLPADLPEENPRKQREPRSLGLPTIRHQLRLFGGQMEIHSRPGVGTQVILLVPGADARTER